MKHFSIVFEPKTGLKFIPQRGFKFEVFKVAHQKFRVNVIKRPKEKKKK